MAITNNTQTEHCIELSETRESQKLSVEVPCASLKKGIPLE